MESARRLLYRVAQAYYDEELTQAEVAKRFGISRIKVSRMLTRAREEGVVRIDVIPPQETQTALEQELESIFGLDEALVAQVDGDDYGDVLESIGRVAADYVIRVLEDGQTLGLTWGNSILATVNALPRVSLPGTRAVQMLGGLGELEAEIHGAELVRRAAERLGCRPRNIHAPGIVASKAVRDALVADPQVADTLELGRSADVALLGIGALGPHSVLRGASSALTQADCRVLVEQGVVGDIALRFFDANGRPVATPFAERTIGVGLGEIRGIGKRVGVAGGPEKRDAMLAALRGGHLNVLVTDADTARALVAAAAVVTTEGNDRASLRKPTQPARGRS